ncbi:MAG: beta-lactamase hydrolase domain-containing protein [Gemmatimonadales bacterium]
MSLLHAAREITNASSPLPWLVVTGQPTATALAELHDAGVSTVIDIRDSMEPREIDEPSVVTALGMQYVNAPMIFGALSDAAMERVLAALRAAKGTPTLLHCNSANRTGGPLIAYLVLDEGMSEESAVAAAMTAGLRSAEVLEFATAYAREHRK